MSKEDQEPDFLDYLAEDAKKQLLMLLAGAFVLIIGSIGTQGVALLALLAMYLSTRKPGPSSFMLFFERFFKERLFPGMQEKLRLELEQRSRDANRSFLGSLSDAAAGFLVANTSSIRGDIAWSQFRTRVRPAFRDFWMFRTASVNMGTASDPVVAVFIGINMEWYLSPHIKLDFEHVSVLSMMEGVAEQ